MKTWKCGCGHWDSDHSYAGVPETGPACLRCRRNCHIHVCVHHPDAKDPEFARCWCRKPSGGAIAEAVHGLKARHPDEFYPPYMARMVGDRPEDEECARQAGLDFTWAAEWRSEPIPEVVV